MEVTVVVSNGRVILRFGDEVPWQSLTPEEAAKLAELLLEKAILADAADHLYGRGE